MSYQKKVILLAGPTASGKSKLAIELARYFDGEIINADSMQIYKEISILTSRPKKSHINLAKHHLYGVRSVKQNFSVGDWLNIVIRKIENIQKKSHIPIIVGGTGLYFKALTEGLVKIPKISTKLRKEARDLHAKIGQKKFYQKLINLDPLSKKFIKQTDSQRSMRAYEVKKYTGKSLFIFIKKTKSNFNSKTFIKLFINTPKEILHKKINHRVEKMFEENVVEEVKFFINLNLKKDLSSNKIIGISEIKDYIKGKQPLAKTKELIKLKTRQYAKRQFTWSRGNMRSWEMIYSPNFDDLYKKAINKIV